MITVIFGRIDRKLPTQTTWRKPDSLLNELSNMLLFMYVLDAKEFANASVVRPFPRHDRKQ